MLCWYGYTKIMSFSNKWIKPQQNDLNNVGMKLLENIKPPSPLKPRIEEAQKRLHSQISKLESMSMKMEEKDQVIFKRVISAMQSHDSQYAKILSNELSQIRKMNKMITSAKLALEQIQLRLNTITELGDVIVTLSPAMSVIKNIQGGLTSMMPEAGQSFGKITDILNGIMNESGQIPQTTEIPGNSNSLGEDAMKIIEEASAIVEQNMKDKFPDLPNSTIDSKVTESNSLY
jgi:division protein CdvB (Snf7/Vps24/ESCRT-III family)